MKIRQQLLWGKWTLEYSGGKYSQKKKHQKNEFSCSISTVSIRRFMEMKFRQLIGSVAIKWWYFFWKCWAWKTIIVGVKKNRSEREHNIVSVWYVVLQSRGIIHWENIVIFSTTISIRAYFYSQRKQQQQKITKRK